MVIIQKEKKKLIALGDSISIVIPKDFVTYLNWKIDDEVFIDIKNKNIIISKMEEE